MIIQKVLTLRQYFSVKSNSLNNNNKKNSDFKNYNGKIRTLDRRMLTPCFVPYINNEASQRYSRDSDRYKNFLRRPLETLGRIAIIDSRRLKRFIVDSVE